ncbi:hypothetical protein [Chryseobacterium luquanense]|uniref:Uncharacterized protein n=1 Tax=Chryseobacterium luquanense TaxID=2983766 RepID=A0ABT3XZF5_9FLAO|nr:hypothetical protein [Chryseobacterium luquanense]MCX8531278.1 hypothetical protein [Chryseobacterium luquanense]
MRQYKEYIKDDPNFKKLFENAAMIVGHVYETAYCINKLTKEEFCIFEFLEDPSCSIVGENNDWCLIGGNVLILKTLVDNTLRLVGDFKQIFDLKYIDAYTAQILTDPWSENSEIWQISFDVNKFTQPLTLSKIRDFKEYFDKPYSENIKW